MADVAIYHPVTQATVLVPHESVSVHRQAGWLLRSEWDASQAQAAERQAERDKAERDDARASQAARTPMPKGARGDSEK